MRYGIVAIAVVAVLALTMAAQADYVLLRDNLGTGTLDVGGTTYDVTVTPFDDTSIIYWAGGSTRTFTNYGQDLTMKMGIPGSGEQNAIIGIKNLLSFIPSGVTITSAKLGLVSDGVGTNKDTMAVHPVTANWLLDAAGASEGTGGYDNTTGTPISNGPSDDYIEGDGDTTKWPGNKAFHSADPWDTTYGPTGAHWEDTLNVQNLYDVTDIVEAWDNDLGTLNNYGFVVRNLTGVAKIYAFSSENYVNDVDSTPFLLVEYSTGVIPEPGTMLLLGTGVLGVIGYMRRKRMR